MGGILTAIIHHWATCLTVLGTSILGWLAGYLRGYHQGEEAEMDRRYHSQLAAERHIASLNQRLDFIHAERDHWKRRVHQLERHLIAGAHLQAMPPKIVSTTELFDAAAARAQAIPDGTRDGNGTWRDGIWYPDIGFESTKAPGPKEPPTPPGYKEIG